MVPEYSSPLVSVLRQCSIKLFLPLLIIWISFNGCLILLTIYLLQRLLEKCKLQFAKKQRQVEPDSGHWCGLPGIR